MAIPRLLKQLASGIIESLTSGTSKSRGSASESKRKANSKPERNPRREKPGHSGSQGSANNRGSANNNATGRKPTSATSSGQSDGDGASSGPTLTAHSPSELPGVDDLPRVYSVPDLGLPAFAYTPQQDEAPDPGEVVWTWVPYEEDRSQGKDRPVLVLAEFERCIVFVQLTSKDHARDAEQEARNGRFWIDVGSGDWDSKGRPSEARIDRLLCVSPARMRREGGRLDEARFTEVVSAIRRFHR